MSSDNSYYICPDCNSKMTVEDRHSDKYVKCYLCNCKHKIVWGIVITKWYKWVDGEWKSNIEFTPIKKYERFVFR